MPKRPRIRVYWTVGFLCLLSARERTIAQAGNNAFDVLAYVATITPDIANRRLSGDVSIHLRFSSDSVKTIELDRGDLTIDRVRYRDQRVAFEMLPRRLR